MKKTDYVPEFVTDERTVAAYLEITKIVRDSLPMYTNERGQSIGENIDAYINMALGSGEEIQDITLHFNPEQWAEMRSKRQAI